jgi:hypothetical protein
MRFHHWLRCVVASLFVVVTQLTATFGQSAASQPANSQPKGPPSPSTAMVGYRTLESWVRAWQVPATPPVELAPVTCGVHVQLRLNGELIGRGSEFPDAAGASGSALLAATHEAMRMAESRITLPNDAMRDDAMKVQAGLMMISVEFAGPLTVIEPTTWADAEVSLAPGLEGVAVAARMQEGGTGRVAASFPSFQMSTDTLPHRALAGLCAMTIGDGGAAAALDEPKRIRERHGVRMYGFRTTHLAQCKPGGEPVFLYRGTRLIDQSEITAAELGGMASLMARHMGEMSAEEIGCTYRPATGKVSSEPRTESVALELFALRNYLCLAPEHPNLRPRVKARGAMEQRAAWVSGLPGSAHIDADATMFLLAMLQSPGKEPPLPVDASTALPKASEPVRWLAERPWAKNQMMGELDPAVQGLCAAAYAIFPRTWVKSADGPMTERPTGAAKSAVRDWIGAIPPGQFVGHMPWLGFAEMELAKREEEAGKRVDIPSAVALREMRRQVWEHQVGPMDVEQDSMDFAGGIVFTKGGTPLPTWQCTRPLAFIATMLGEQRLTEPNERALELAKLMQSMRFIRQLMADESIGWMAKDPAKAIGGVRAAPWDFSMPPDATSMALITVVEALSSLERLSQQQPAPAIEPAR